MSYPQQPPHTGNPGPHVAPPAYGPPAGWGGAQPSWPAPAGHAPAGYGHPALPPAYPQQPQLQMIGCRLCGSIPAVHTTFRGHQGMVFVMRFLKTEGPFCRDCGLGVFRRMTSRTLVQGWYGYASMIITPITVLLNLTRRGKVAQLAQPQPHPHLDSRPPMDPGPRLMQRPTTWIGMLIPFALLALIILAIATSN